MMIKELNLAGVFLAPMLLYVVVSGGVWYALRAALGQIGAYRFIWHPALFNTALFVIILAAVVALGVR